MTFGVTSNPNEEWLKNIIRSHFAFIDNFPDVLISDRDGIYGKWFKLFLKNNYQIKLIKTPPQFPICNSFAERMVRTFRNESIDHMLIYNQKDLEKTFKSYINYYNCQRTHSSIDFYAPKTDFSKSKRKFQTSKVKKEKVLNGLITDFSLAAA